MLRPVVSRTSSSFEYKLTKPHLDIPLLLSYYRALLSLLQQLCQTKVGATHVLNAGLFTAVRESRLFAADPDIGIGLPLIDPHFT
jgi:nuclear pore complex protein Nup205